SALAHRVLFSLRSAAYQPARERRMDSGLEADLERLAAIALWPVLETWGELPRALAVAPVGPLTRIPWAALPLPGGRRVCEASRVVLVPGLRLGISTRQSARPSGAPLIIASDSGDLAHVSLETADLGRRFPDAEVLEGSAATVSAVLERLPAAPWIHFAG